MCGNGNTNGVMKMEKNDCLLGHIHADNVSKHMHVAYWTNDYPKKMHEENAHTSFKKLADVMGYNVVLRSQC